MIYLLEQMGITFDDELTLKNFLIMKKIKKSLFAILCASLFPLIYVIGKTIIWFFHH
jgi:hypothetical protein